MLYLALIENIAHVSLALVPHSDCVPSNVNYSSVNRCLVFAVLIYMATADEIVY